MKHPHFSKLWLGVCLVLVIAVLGVPTALAQDKIVVTWWNGFTGPDRPALEEIVKQFNASQDKIEVQVTITPWDSLYQTLLSSMSSGEGPDLIGVNYTKVPQYAEAGVVADLTPYFVKDSNLDPALFSDTLLNLMKVGDQYFAAPVNFATLLMYYNKDMFAAAGLDPEKPPATQEEWVAALRALTKDGQYGIAIGERQTIPNWPIFLWSQGADVLTDGKASLNTPEAIAALDLWGGLVRDEGVSPFGLTGAEADQLFQTQRAAMGVTGPWMVNGFTEAGINFDVAPIPAGPAGPVTLADTVVFMVNANSDETHQAAAVEFMNYWNSRESQLLWSQMTGFPPARLDLADDPALFEANPWAAKFAAVVPFSRFYLPNEKFATQIDNDIFVPMIQSITQGVASAEDAANAANAQIEALMGQ